MQYTQCLKPLSTTTDCLVLGEFSDKPQYTEILKSLQQDKLFTGELNKSITLYQLPGTAAKIVVLVGCGEQKLFNHHRFLKVIKQCTGELTKLNLQDVIIYLPGLDDSNWQLQQTILAVETSRYSFDKFKSKHQPPTRLNQVQISLPTLPTATFDTTVIHAQAIAAGMNLCRDLGNAPANICTPTYLAEAAQKLSQKFPKIVTHILDEADMEQLNMGALLAVAKGSEQRAKLVTLNYQGAQPSQASIVLVGKGITFDSGGISLKPSLNMDEMKYDMCGAASVLGTLQAVAQLQLPLNVVGILACAENLPSGHATKPGDIVTTHAGLTVEILNTDAEGRLVLCDALSYAAKFNPSIVIDIATLTGAIIVALGYHLTGIMGNNEELIQQLITAGKAAGDKGWALPMSDEYQEAIDGTFADLANISNDRTAGSVAAACFLSRFTAKYRWAHLDIAGTAWTSGKNKGATGRPIPLLTQFLINQCK